MLEYLFSNPIIENMLELRRIKDDDLVGMVSILGVAVKYKYAA